MSTELAELNIRKELLAHCRLLFPFSVLLREIGYQTVFIMLSPPCDLAVSILVLVDPSLIFYY